LASPFSIAGPGESGKSTVFKQLKMMDHEQANQAAIDSDDMLYLRDIIFENVTSYLQTLINCLENGVKNESLVNKVRGFRHYAFNGRRLSDFFDLFFLFFIFFEKKTAKSIVKDRHGERILWSPEVAKTYVALLKEDIVQERLKTLPHGELPDAAFLFVQKNPILLHSVLLMP
jgi:hypothetical protein